MLAVHVQFDKLNSVIQLNKHWLSKVDENLHPHVLFNQFLHSLSYDHSVLLDFLISNETDFLGYLLQYLKYTTNHWEEFNEVVARLDNNIQKDEHEELVATFATIDIQGQTKLEAKKDSEMDVIMSVLIRLRFSIEKLVVKNLFPYNITPLLKKLKDMEHLYENNN